METNKENKRPRFKTPKRDSGMNTGSEHNNDRGLEDRTYARSERVMCNYNDNPRPQRRESEHSTDSRRPNSYEQRPMRPERPSNYGRSAGYNSEGHNRDNSGYNRNNSEGHNRNNSGYNRDNSGSNRDNSGYNRDNSGSNRDNSRGYNRENNYNQANAGFDRPNRSDSNLNRERNNWGESENGSPMRNNRPHSNNNNRPQNSFSRGGNSTPPIRRNKFDSKPRLPQPVEYRDTFIDPNEPIRLNKYLSNAGVCSRREADEYIKKGEVAVNGTVITELGVKVSRTDTVTFHDQIVGLERKVYVLLNKPKNCVTTVDDPDARVTVMDLVAGACNERIYPVGRLDRYTTGVLLLTNDGDLASKLTHPKFLKKKIYHVTLDRDVPISDLEKIAEGIELEDGMIQADAISYASEDDMTQIGIEIHSGKNRIVRRIFEHLGYKVHKLDRVLFAGLTKKSLSRGRWRHLTQDEVNMLKMGAFE